MVRLGAFSGEFSMALPNRRYHSLFLLSSVLLFFVATPLLETGERGETLVVLNLYLTLVAATVKLSERRKLFLLAIPLAGASIGLLWLSHVYHTKALGIASRLSLMTFIGLVCGSLFVYLGKKGAIDRERILVSVGLYFLIGIFWFAVYELTNVVQPGSFAEAGTTLTGKIPASKMLYFSLTSLTTLGFGDIVPIMPPARMFTALEATSGVLYIAITVARLVASYQTTLERD
jgi:Ion channel